MRSLLIGDIHGCYAELQDLLALAALTSVDEIVSVGDLVDRGPAPADVLAFFRTQPNARAILGNHELKHLRWFRGEGEPSLSQRITREQLGEAAWMDACGWMATLPRYLDLEAALVTHGFFVPGVPLSEQPGNVLTGTMSGERRLHELGAPWYELYDGEKPLVVGHRDYLRNGQALVWRDRVFGIDTRCYAGGRLTGLLLPEFRLVSVPARGNAWQSVRAQFAHVLPMALRLPELTWSKAESLLSSLRARDDEESAEAIGAVTELLRAGEAAVDGVLAHLQAECERARAAIAPDLLGTAAEGAEFARCFTGSPLVGLLHQHRKRPFDRTTLRTQLARPAVAAMRWHEVAGR